jgi:putative chitinase
LDEQAMIDAVLLQRAVGCTASNAERFAGPLAAACAFYGIEKTPARLAMFLATIGHESGSLRYLKEIWGPTPAQQRYEGREDIGNTQPGDGKRYMGRGGIHTTGRYNYARVRDRLRARFPTLNVPDFEADPDALMIPQWAALAAADFIDDNDINRYADADDFDGYSDEVNRGRKTKAHGDSNGWADRLLRLKRAQAAIAAQTPSTEPSKPAEPEGVPVAKNLIEAILGSALPTLIQAAPELIRAVGDSEQSEKNARVMEIVADVVTQTTGAPNLQAGVESIAADPAVAANFRAGVQERFFEISEAGGGGIAGARQANMNQPAPKMNLALWVTAALLPLVYMTVGAVLFGSDWSTDVKAMVVAAVVTGVLGAVTAFWLGTSFSSSRKTDMLAGKQ